MKKYFVIARNRIQKLFAYRYFIVAYAGGNFLELATQIVIWTAIFKSAEMINGYHYGEMLAYLIVGWIFRFLTTNYEYEALISRDIKLGRLSNFIIKPLDYLKYIFADSIGRLAIAFVVVILQALIWISIFHEELIFRIDLITFFILIGMFILSFVIKLLFSALIGFIAFWTMEVHGISSALNVFIKIFSGAYFPLDIMSGVFASVALNLPFAYALYYPVQIFLGRIGIEESFRALGIMVIWVFVLWFCVRGVWKVGLKKYESAGI